MNPLKINLSPWLTSLFLVASAPALIIIWAVSSYASKGFTDSLLITSAGFFAANILGVLYVWYIVVTKEYPFIQPQSFGILDPIKKRRINVVWGLCIIGAITVQIFYLHYSVAFVMMGITYLAYLEGMRDILTGYENAYEKTVRFVQNKVYQFCTSSTVPPEVNPIELLNKYDLGTLCIKLYPWRKRDTMDKKRMRYANKRFLLLIKIKPDKWMVVLKGESSTNDVGDVISVDSIKAPVALLHIPQDMQFGMYLLQKATDL